MQKTLILNACSKNVHINYFRETKYMPAYNDLKDRSINLEPTWITNYSDNRWAWTSNLF